MYYIRLVLGAAFLAAAAGKPLVKGSKDWNNVDWDAAAKSLEDGDEEDLLESEDAAQIRDLEKRKAAGMTMPEGDVALQDPSEWVRHTQAMTGPTMLFVTLKSSTSPDGKPWADQPKRVIEDLTSRWKELLKTAGLDAMCYEIGEGRILVSMQTGWRGYDVRDFLLDQAEVDELEWDSVKYHPGEELPARPGQLGAGGAGIPGLPPGMTLPPGMGGAPAGSQGKKSPVKSKPKKEL